MLTFLLLVSRFWWWEKICMAVFFFFFYSVGFLRRFFFFKSIYEAFFPVLEWRVYLKPSVSFWTGYTWRSPGARLGGTKCNLMVLCLYDVSSAHGRGWILIYTMRYSCQSFFFFFSLSPLYNRLHVEAVYFMFFILFLIMCKNFFWEEDTLVCACHQIQYRPLWWG